MKLKEQKKETLGVWILLIASILLFWWRVWIPTAADQMHFTDDILIKDYPARVAMFHWLLSGWIPLWNPLEFGGWPGIANCEVGFFYPFNWVLIPFAYSPQTSFFVTEMLILFHFFLGGLGTYRLGRHIGLSRLGSMMAAIVVTFCGFHCAHKKHTNMIFTLVWFPWLLLCLERWLKEKHGKCLFYLSLILGMAFFAGHPQASLYITLILLCRGFHAAWLETQAQSARQTQLFCKRVLPLLLVIVLTAGMTAIQWIPTAELILEGQRSAANQYQSSTEYSMPVIELLDLVFPDLFFPGEQVEVFYWGIIPLLLSILALIYCPLGGFYRFLVAMALFSIVLALGVYTFAYDLSYLFIPGIAWVRAPSRWIYFAGLPLALLAGRGLQECVQNASTIFNQVNVARLKNILMVILGFSLFCFAVYVLIVDASNASSLFHTFLLTWIFVAAFLILISLLALSKLSPQAFAVMMILLAWFDLATHYRFMELQPGPGGHPVDREVRFIHRADWNHRVKVFFDGGGNRSLYHGSAQRFRELDGGSPLTPEIHWQLREDTSLTAFKNPNMTLLDLCGTGIVLTDMVDKFPPPWERETDRMFIKPSPAKRACFYAERFGAEPKVQRQLLHLQSLPFDRVLFASSKQDEAAPLLDPGRPLFPKPFLLASCSGNALDPSAHLIVDGKDYFEEFQEDAGYILALADADRGRIETVKRFDLNQDYDAELGRVKSPPTENLRMQQFLASIPEGKYVLGAVNDNATNMVLEETLFAFRSVGACIDIRKQFRLAHAFIGRKGDPVGSAFEIVSPTEAYVLRTKQSVFSHGNTRGQLVLSNVLRRPNRKREPFPPQLKDTRYPNLALEIEGVSREMEIRLREPLAVYSSPFRLSAQSRGQAAIEIGGKDYAKNRRGYNIVVYDPATQTVVGSEVFDLIADYDAERGQVNNPPVENLRMQAFLQNVADGHVILGAIKEEAIDLLSESTLRVLQQLGSSMRFMANPEQRKRLSHAFFTVKGTGYFVEESAKETDAVLFTRIQGSPDYAGEDRVETASFQSDFTPLSELRDSQERLGHPSLQPAKKMAVIDRGPNRLSISGVFPEEGWLFSNEIFFPGWKVYIDDAEGDIERVNYYFRGVPVPKGAHEITMQYSPKAFQAGILLSAISFVLWAVVIIVFLFLAKPVSKTEGESAKS